MYPRFEITHKRRATAIDIANDLYEQRPEYTFAKWFAGTLGEMATWQYIENAGWSVRRGPNLKHDLSILGPSGKENRCEVKTQIRTVDVKPSYCVNVNAKAYEQQKHDFYVFGSLRQGISADTAHALYVELVGWCMRKSVPTLGILLKPGDKYDNGQQVTKEVWSIPISKLRPMDKIDDAMW